MGKEEGKLLGREAPAALADATAEAGASCTTAATAGVAALHSALPGTAQAPAALLGTFLAGMPLATGAKGALLTERSAAAAVSGGGHKTAAPGKHAVTLPPAKDCTRGRPCTGGSFPCWCKPGSVANSLLVRVRYMQASTWYIEQDRVLMVQWK